MARPVFILAGHLHVVAIYHFRKKSPRTATLPQIADFFLAGVAREKSAPNALYVFFQFFGSFRILPRFDLALLPVRFRRAQQSHARLDSLCRSAGV
jgi:hypothetical protein